MIYYHYKPLRYQGSGVLVLRNILLLKIPKIFNGIKHPCSLEITAVYNRLIGLSY